MPVARGDRHDEGGCEQCGDCLSCYGEDICPYTGKPHDSEGVDIKRDTWALAIGTGDVVRHRPSGEEWLVAYVDGDRLAWCGWPPGDAPLLDFELVRKATEKEYWATVHMMENSGGRKGEVARELLQGRHDNQDLGEGEG